MIYIYLYRENIIFQLNYIFIFMSKINNNNNNINKIYSINRINNYLTYFS